MTKPVLVITLILLVAGIASAQDEPKWIPGNPTPYSWNNIESKLWWPNSYTPRADKYECIARALRVDTGDWHTFTYRHAPIPYIQDHRYMHAINNYVYSGVQATYTMTEGSCYILNAAGSVMYTVPIDGLPWRAIINRGPTVFVPALSRPGLAITQPEAQQ